MEFENQMLLKFTACSQNESFARLAAAAFLMQFDPTVSELTDIKTAVSEAVTNAIIHGYEKKEGQVTLFCGYQGDSIYIEVKDEGQGIEDVNKAREPLFTTKPDMERSGLGFTVMETFMDKISVESAPGEGTVVKMVKTLKKS